MLKRISALLNRPLLGTRVIPPNARVNASLFPEDEFPVSCPKCDYRLQGLRENRCPECGESFDRGRLLVEQYVTQARQRHWRGSRHGQIVVWLMIGGGLLVIAGAILVPLAWKWLFPLVSSGTSPRAFSSFVDWTRMSVRVVMLLQVVVLAALLVSYAGMARAYRRQQARRRRVLDAIPPGDQL